MHFKLKKIGTISVEPDGFQMPSDLQAAISKQADEKGGKYYVVTSVQERDGGLAGTVTVYK